MYENAEILINGTPFWDSRQCFQTEMYVHALLDGDFPDNSLTAALWQIDQTGGHDMISSTAKEVNPGAYNRLHACKNSRIIDLFGKFLPPPFRTQPNNILLDGVSLDIK